MELGGHRGGSRGFDSLQPHVVSQRLAKKRLLVLPGRPFLNAPSEGIEPAVCANSFAMIFDQLMHFFIRRDFSPYRFLLSLLDEAKRAPLF